MYKVFFTNFGYYSVNESTTIEGARKIAKAAGFESTIEHNGETVASFCPVMGWNNYAQKTA